MNKSLLNSMLEYKEGVKKQRRKLANEFEHSKNTNVRIELKDEIEKLDEKTILIRDAIRNKDEETLRNLASEYNVHFLEDAPIDKNTKKRKLLKKAGAIAGIFAVGVGTGSVITSHYRDAQISESQNDEEEQNETKSIDEIAQEVIDSKWGDGEERKTRLISAGYDYEKVQEKVNELIEKKEKEETSIANDIVAGKYGHYHAVKSFLNENGYDYNSIIAKVNEILASTDKPTVYEDFNRSFNESIASEVIVGEWGNGIEREAALKAAGFDYDAIMEIVNEKIESNPLSR